MSVDFPTCLAVNADGTPVLSSPNFRSHAAYPVNNICPPDFPYHIPLLDLEVRYDLKAMRAMLGREVVDKIDNWHLSTMDKTCAGAHADFVSGALLLQLLRAVAPLVCTKFLNICASLVCLFVSSLLPFSHRGHNVINFFKIS
jgi:hypothetical protein